MKQDSLTLYRQLVAAIREEAMEDMVAQLRAGAAAPPLRREVAATVRAMRTASAPRMAAKHKGAQARTPDEIEKVIEQVCAYLAKHPGQNMRQLAAALGLTSVQLRHPMLKLVERKGVTTKGKRSGMRYTIRA